MSTENKILATGRRKTSVARVSLMTEGTGKFLVNGRQCDDFFPTIVLKQQVMEALEVSGLKDKVDVKATVRGGGITGQAGAVRLGLARAILEFNEENKLLFKEGKLLTRDPRAKERKKYGQKGARSKFQWTKR